MKKILLTILSILLLITAGCQKQEQPNQKPPMSAKLPAANVSGEVLEISDTGNRILVESTNEIIKGQIWIGIDEETNFFENLDEGIALAYKNVSRDFKVGNHVELYVGGDIAESYPMQATATSVYINTNE